MQLMSLLFFFFACVFFFSMQEVGAIGPDQPDAGSPTNGDRKRKRDADSVPSDEESDSSLGPALMWCGSGVVVWRPSTS